MRDSVPSASYSSVCNVLRQWNISRRVYRLLSAPYRNRHGGVQSAAVAEAKISRESKVDSNLLEWCSHLMSDKTKKL